MAGALESLRAVAQAALAPQACLVARAAPCFKWYADDTRESPRGFAINFDLAQTPVLADRLKLIMSSALSNFLLLTMFLLALTALRPHRKFGSERMDELKRIPPQM